MNFEIYPLETYKYRKGLKPISGDLNTIVNTLNTQNKGYHELFENNKKYKFFLDLDKVYEAYTITDVQEALCELMGLNDINDVKFTLSVKTDQEIKNEITGEMKIVDLYSYHVVVPSYHGTLKDIKRLVEDILRRYPLIAEYIDYVVYAENRWFRLPNQTMPNADKPFAHTVTNGSMEDFILAYIPEGSVQMQFNDVKPKKTKKAAEKIYNNDKPIKAQSFVVDDVKLRGWLDMLPDEYLHEYKEWSIMTNLLKGLNKFDVWEEWSKQSDKYNLIKNRSIWRSCKKIVFDINYLLKLVDLERIPAFKPYVPITKEVPNKKVINNYRIVDNNDTFTYEEFCSNENIIIKSCCGTGKTYGTAIHMRKYLKANSDKKLVCITDRISLGQQMLASFNSQNVSIVNYKLNSYNPEKNYLCCINSLHKLSHLTDEEFEDFIVYIDEINTFLKNYTHNETLDAHLSLIHTTLMRIIKFAHKIIFTDARINDGVFELLQGRNVNKTIFIDNQFKKFQDVPAIRINDQPTLIKTIRNNIAKNEYFTFASDSCKVVEEIYSAVIDGLDKDLIKDKYILITSNHPFEITNASEQFKDKYVFYSPSIVTGVDITLANCQDVFIYIKGDTLDAESSYQQATRTRNIKSLYYFCNTKEREENYNTLEDTKQTYLNFIKNDEKLTSLCATRTEDDLDCSLVRNKFFNIFCYNEYNKDVFNTNRRKHFEIILTDEGFKLETMQDKKEEEQDAEEREQDFSNLRAELANQLFNEFVDSEDKSNIKFVDINNILMYFNLPNDKDILTKFREFIINQYVRSEHFRVIAFFKTDEYINNKIEEQKAVSYDVKKMTDKYRKIKLFRELQNDNGYSLLDLNKVEDPEAEFKCNYSWSYIKKQFHTSKEQPKTRADFKTLYLSFLRHITSTEIIESKVVSKRGTKSRIYSFNDAFLKLNIELNQFSNHKFRNYDEQYESLLNIKIVHDVPMDFITDDVNELDKNIQIV
jgi:hypothetical protein